MEYYLWIKVLHIASFISWMAGVFYLPRLFIYHKEHNQNKGFVKVVKIQEYKLLFYITIPAMWSSILSGIAIIYIIPSLLSQNWMLLKLFFVLILFIYTYSLKHYLFQLKNDKCKKSGKFFRFYNEVPTILMIIIVIFVIIRPSF